MANDNMADNLMAMCVHYMRGFRIFSAGGGGGGSEVYFFLGVLVLK